MLATGIIVLVEKSECIIPMLVYDKNMGGIHIFIDI